jgi:hypothetical protein
VQSQMGCQIRKKTSNLNFYVIVNPIRCSNFSNLFYFWDNTPRVSDGLSVHHQELKTVHTATGICQRGTAICGKTVRNMCYPRNKINLRSCCILLDLL